MIDHTNNVGDTADETSFLLHPELSGRLCQASSARKGWGVVSSLMVITPIAVFIISIFLCVKRNTLSMVGSTASISSNHFSKEEHRIPPIPDVLLAPSHSSGQLEAQDKPTSFVPQARVTFDGRSILVDNERVLLLGGSIHPVRATRATWERVLDQMVSASLNTVTMYVMWSAHQQKDGDPWDWSFPSDKGWTLAEAIAEVGIRGMWVHIRLGPYACAEYSFGGIPEWVSLSDPTMTMRRPNLPWMRAMELYLRTVITYLQDNELFVYQDGPIIMGQVENELGENDDEEKDYWAMVDANGLFVERGHPDALRNATLQDYADWCGEIAQALEPNILWTMCNGLSANNTIDTYNGFFNNAKWLEQGGDNGRIQVDQPALWTESEGGFQLWGEEPLKPKGYVWGVTARAQAYTAIRWIARGGTHLNFYMWWGGYNRGRAAAASIANMYATDAPVCPSGEPRQPKYDHFQALLKVLADVAPVLLGAAKALDRAETLYVRKTNANKDAKWFKNEKVLSFSYSMVDANNAHVDTIVLFVENGCQLPYEVRVPGAEDQMMAPHSASIFVNGKRRFYSAGFEKRAQQYRRFFQFDAVKVEGCQSWLETVDMNSNSNGWKQVTQRRPFEQTVLNAQFNLSSDYARYFTTFELERQYESVILSIETQHANAFTAFVDQEFIGEGDNHDRQEGPITLQIALGALTKGVHRLTLLSESLGYNNLIGRWGGSTNSKLKGITGAVWLTFVGENDQIQNLVDGYRSWTSLPGLRAKGNVFGTAKPLPTTRHSHVQRPIIDISQRFTVGQWTKCSFYSPVYDARKQQLYTKMAMGRGHLWLNGHDLGRYWNITWGTSVSTYTQSHYFLPDDYLTKKLNDLLWFNSIPAKDPEPAKLLLSWVDSSDEGFFPDIVGEVDVCLQ